MRRAAMEGLVKSSTLGKYGREKSCDSPAEISSADYFVVDLDDNISEDTPSKLHYGHRAGNSAATCTFQLWWHPALSKGCMHLSANHPNLHV